MNHNLPVVVLALQSTELPTPVCVDTSDFRRGDEEENRGKKMAKVRKKGREILERERGRKRATKWKRERE